MSRFLIFSAVILVCTLPISAQQTRVLAPHKPIAPKIANPGKVHGSSSLRAMVGGVWMIQQPKVLAPHNPVGPKLPYSGTSDRLAVPRSMVGGFMDN